MRNFLPPTAILCAATALLLCAVDGQLIVSEIHYHPSDTDQDLTEWIEVKNVGDAPVDSTNFTFGGLGTINLPATIVAPGEFLLLAGDTRQFRVQYGISATGSFSGTLSNRSETVSISDSDQSTVFSVRYWDGATPGDALEAGRDTWPASPDGSGLTLTLFDASKAPKDPDDPRNWRPSIQLFGSPNANEPVPSPVPEIVVNEIYLSTTDNDWIELFNPSSVPIDVGGWWLTDSLDNPMNSVLPMGSIVQPGGYAVYQNGVNGVRLSLKTRNRAGVFLYSAADSGRTLTGYVHGFFFSRFPEGNSLIRYVDSEGKVQLVAAEPTPGVENAPPAAGPVAITEVMYDSGEDGGTDEFLEIMNIGEVTVPLHDPVDTSTNWRVSGIGYAINGI